MTNIIRWYEFLSLESDRSMMDIIRAEDNADSMPVMRGMMAPALVKKKLLVNVIGFMLARRWTLL